MTPKIIHIILIPKRYSFFWKPQKVLKFKIWTPTNDPSLRMYENSIPPPRGDSLSNYDTKYHYLFKLWRRKSCHQKEKLRQKSKQSPDPWARLSPVPSPVSCPVVSDDVQYKLQVSHLKSLDIIHDANSNSFLKMIFQQWYLCFYTRILCQW